jgi:acyl dehydratase
MGINYSLNKWLHRAAARRSRIRARFALAKHEYIGEIGVQHVWNVTVEREGSDKPVMVAEWILRSY